MLGEDLLKETGSMTNSECNEVIVRDWVCECCFNSIVYPKVGSKRQSKSKYTLARNEAFEHAVKSFRY